MAATSFSIAAANTSRSSEYSSVNSTAPLSSIAVQPPSGVGRMSMPDEIRSGRGGCSERELERCAGRIDCLPLGAERDVRPPFAVGRLPPDRSDDSSAGDHNAKVVPQRRDELLHEHALLPEPGARRKRLERLGELGTIGAQGDVSAPASEARLHDHRRLDRDLLARRHEMHGARMRQAGRQQHA